MKIFRSAKPGSVAMVLSIALPMIISQAAETVMLFTDRLFLSYVSPVHISACLAGGMTSFMANTLFLGIIGYVTALSGQFFGAKKFHESALAAIQGVILSFLAYPLLIILIPLLSYLLKNAGHSQLQTSLQVDYYILLSFGSIFFLLRTAFSSFFSGIGETRIVMFANISAMVLNVGINYLLILGKHGFPKLGITGAAYGTIIGSAVGCLILAIYFFFSKITKAYKPRECLYFHRQIFARLMKFGFPAGIEFFLNMVAFNFFVLLMHSYGDTVAAAVTITFNWDIVSFLPLTGIGIAVTSLSGRYSGSGENIFVKTTFRSGLKVALAYGFIMLAIFTLLPHNLANVFNNSSNEQFAEILPLTVSLIRLTSLYILFDGILIVSGGILRGAGDTKWPMWTSVIGHWVLIIFCFPLVHLFKASPVAVWLVFVAMIVILAILFIIRYRSEKWQNLLSEKL
ncbi:MAG: MATE family efflux transporter [Lentisphaeria bacterium]